MELSKLHKVAQDKFAEFEQISVLSILKMLNEFYSDRQCDFFNNLIWQYWSDASATYENDGNTKCAGTKYQALCSVAIARPICDAWEEKFCWYHGHSHSVINFHSDIHLRDHDSIVKYSSCSLQVSPYMVNQNLKENSTLINYTTHDSKMEFHKNEYDMLIMFNLINENFKMKDLHDKIKLLIPIVPS